MRQHYPLLEYLRTIPKKRQKKIIKAGGKEILEALSEICLNLIKKNINLSPQQISKLKPYEKQIYGLSLKKNSVAKKQSIIQRGGAFLSSLLGTLLPAIISSIVATSSK